MNLHLITLPSHCCPLYCWWQWGVCCVISSDNEQENKYAGIILLPPRWYCFQGVAPIIWDHRSLSDYDASRSLIVEITFGILIIHYHGGRCQNNIIAIIIVLVIDNENCCCRVIEIKNIIWVTTVAMVFEAMGTRSEEERLVIVHYC